MIKGTFCFSRLRFRKIRMKAFPGCHTQTMCLCPGQLVLYLGLLCSLRGTGVSYCHGPAGVVATECQQALRDSTGR